ncbi:MAG: glycosyl transferase family 2 [Frondihabitans sp.]|nr:glycosyl transferase family 2 [Frondihabitans sp.]
MPRTTWKEAVTYTKVRQSPDQYPWVCEWELAGDGAPKSLAPAPVLGQPLRALVRLHGQPLGYFWSRYPGANELTSLRLQALDRFGEEVARHLHEEGLALIGSQPLPGATAECPSWAVSTSSLVSVVVCTRDRADQLTTCLDRLVDLNYPNLEIVVVDNASTDDATRRLVEARAASDPRLRYISEPQPGLSNARNRGLAVARGTYVAFTDDDVWVDRWWITGLMHGFSADPRVACATGLVATASITSRAEAYFDARAASWSSRFERMLYDPLNPPVGDLLFPYSAGIFGTGANFCFRRDLALEVGGFDPALGAGAPTRGGEDLDIFVRLIRAGWVISYEPGALVWHHHRADDAALLKQMYSYGTGLTAYLAKTLRDPTARKELLLRVPRGLLKMTHIRRTTRARLSHTIEPPKGALTQELRGMVAGPFLYIKAVRAGGRG